MQMRSVCKCFAIEFIEFLLTLSGVKYDYDRGSPKVTVGEGMWFILIVPITLFRRVAFGDFAFDVFYQFLLGLIDEIMNLNYLMLSSTLNLYEYCLRFDTFL